MKLIKSATVTVGALALAVMPSVALAHDGGTPFDNCTAAYEAGHSNIPEDSPHYGDHLDRDQDGTGCDNAPSDFVPAADEDTTQDTTEDDGSAEDATGQEEPNLAETGGDDMTPYYAGAGALVLLAGAGVLVAARKRRTDS